MAPVLAPAKSCRYGSPRPQPWQTQHNGSYQRSTACILQKNRKPGITVNLEGNIYRHLTGRNQWSWLLMIFCFIFILFVTRKLLLKLLKWRQL